MHLATSARTPEVQQSSEFSSPHNSFCMLLFACACSSLVPKTPLLGGTYEFVSLGYAVQVISGVCFLFPCTDEGPESDLSIDCSATYNSSGGGYDIAANWSIADPLAEEAVISYSVDLRMSVFAETMSELISTTRTPVSCLRQVFSQIILNPHCLHLFCYICLQLTTIEYTNQSVIRSTGFYEITVSINYENSWLLK